MTLGPHGGESRGKKRDEGRRKKGEISFLQVTQKANPVVLVISSLHLWTLAFLRGK